MVLNIIFNSWLKTTVVGRIKPYFVQVWDEHPILTTIFATSLVTLMIYMFIKRRLNRVENLKSVLKRKHEARQAQFDDLRSTFKMTKDANAILSLDWMTLVEKLQTRKLTATQVLSAFIAKSLEVTAYCNAVTEFNPKAIEIAKKLDAMSDVKGPLHGIPFSVKDDTDLEGMDSTLGVAKNCFKPKTESAALVLVLEKLGGVPFCKTNVPQTLLSFGSDNPVFGLTTSSHNNKLCPGGSSSGTGALVGGFGCFFGIGTDTGGSLRIPAHFNGVSTLKPTSGRVTARGVSATLPFLVGLDATTGIIGINSKVVSDVYKLILKDNFQAQFDKKVIPLPWNEELFSSSTKPKLRIGYFTHLPFFPPIGDTVSTIENAVSALRSQGHTVLPIEMPDGADVMRIAGNYMFADQFRSCNNLLKGEVTSECSKTNKIAGKCPKGILKLAAFLLKQKWLPWIYSRSLASMTDVGALTSASLWENKEKQQEMIQNVLKKWTQLDLDFCLSPVMPFPAIPHHLPGLLPVAVVYTMLWNVLDFPAGVVKFGVESGKNIDSYDDQGDQALRLSKKACKQSIGSPIGLQVIALPYKEEVVLRGMELISSLCNNESHQNNANKKSKI